MNIKILAPTPAAVLAATLALPLPAMSAIVSFEIDFDGLTAGQKGTSPWEIAVPGVTNLTATLTATRQNGTSLPIALYDTGQNPNYQNTDSNRPDDDLLSPFFDAAQRGTSNTTNNPLAFGNIAIADTDGTGSPTIAPTARSLTSSSRYRSR